MNYIGDFAEDEAIYTAFNTFTSDDPSASCTITNFTNTDVHIHKDDGTTQRNNASGVTVHVDFDGVTGSHMIKIDTSDDTVVGFWVTGHDYFVRIEGSTVDGATVNIVICHFSIENRLMRGTNSAALAATALTDATWTDAKAAFIDHSIATVDGNVDSILTDTGELQTNQSAWATATGFSTHSAADVKTSVEQAGSSLAQILEDTGTSLPADIAAVGGYLLDAEIAVVTDQTHFTLATGSDIDDAYKDQTIVLYDDTNNDYPSVRKITDYVGATKTVTLDSAPDFTLAADDSVKIFVSAPGSTAPTVGEIRTEMEGVGTKLTLTLEDTADLQGNQAAWATATGFNTVTPDAAGVAAGLHATTDGLITTVDGVVDDILTDTDELQTNQGNWATAATVALNPQGKLDVNAECDTALTDYGANTTVPDAAGIAATLHGTTDGLITTVDGVVDTIAIDVAGLDGDVMRGTDGANTAIPDVAGTAAGLHGTTDGKIDVVDGIVDDILTDTGTTLPARFTGVEGATFATDTDSLEAIRNRGDGEWITATGFNTTVPDAAGTAATLHGTTDGLITTVDGNVDDILTDTGTTLPARFTGLEGATFNTTTDSNEAIRNRGDAEWVTGGGAAAPTVGEIRTEMEGAGTKLTLALEDTADLQANQGAWATATGFATSGALTTHDGKLDTVDGIVDNILVDTGTTLDGKLDTVDGIVDDILTDTGTTLPARFTGLEGATFNTVTDSNEAIRDRGDAEWSAAAGNPNVLVDTTIDAVTDQTHFTLIAGSTVDDAYNDQAIVVYDASNSDYPSVRVVSDYVGSTKGIVLDSAADFTLVSGDGVKTFVTAPGTTAPTVGQIRIEMDTNSTKMAPSQVLNDYKADVSGLAPASEYDTEMAHLDIDVSSRNATTPPTVTQIREEMDTNSTKMAPSQALADYKATGFNTVIPDVAGTAAGLHTTTDGLVTTVDGVVDDILTDTDELQGNQGNWLTATSVTVSDKTGFSLSTAGIKAIWDQLTNVLTTVGSTGKLLVDNINATISSRNSTTPPTVTEIRTEMDTNSTKMAPSQTLNDYKATGFNTVVPDAAGTAPTAIAIRQEMDTNSTKMAPSQTLADYKATGFNTVIPDIAGTAPTVAAIKAEIVDVLKVDTTAEMSQGAPPAEPTLEEMISYIYFRMRNKCETTGSKDIVYDNTGTVELFKATISDDGTTFTKTEYASGE